MKKSPVFYGYWFRAWPNVYYISVPVKPYLQDMDTILKTIESGIKSDAVQHGDPFVHDKIDTIPSTDEGLKKVRQIRSLIRKEFGRS